MVVQNDNAMPVDPVFGAVLLMISSEVEQARAIPFNNRSRGWRTIKPLDNPLDNQINPPLDYPPGMMNIKANKITDLPSQSSCTGSK